MLKISNLHVVINKTPILQNINLEVEKGDFVGIIGPNGSGKSTLLRCIYQSLKPNQGVIEFEGVNIDTLKPTERAQQIAAVLQEMPSDFDFNVQEVVMMGRIPFKKWLETDTIADEEKVRDALKAVDLLGFEQRPFHTLSGGEKQRVLTARALVQTPTFLLLDEPTNHLDIRHQISMMRLFKGLGITLLAALHDLNLASAFCQRVLILKEGKVYDFGTPQKVITAEMIREVYDVAAVVTIDEKGVPFVRFGY